MVNSFLGFVADAAMWICPILNNMVMVRSGGLVLCRNNESLCFSLETGGFEPLVCCFRINISVFNS